LRADYLTTIESEKQLPGFWSFALWHASIEIARFPVGINRTTEIRTFANSAGGAVYYELVPGMPEGPRAASTRGHTFGECDVEAVDPGRFTRDSAPAWEGGNRLLSFPGACREATPFLFSFRP